MTVDGSKCTTVNQPDKPTQLSAYFGAMKVPCGCIMIAKKKLNPSRLPPSTSSAAEHILSSYFQYHNWVTLDTASLNPLHYGWEMSSEGYYRLIPTKAAIAPAGIHTCYMVRSPPSRWSGLHHTHRVGGVTYVSTVLGWWPKLLLCCCRCFQHL